MLGIDGFWKFPTVRCFDIRVNIKMRLLKITSVKVNENDWIDFKCFFSKWYDIEECIKF